MQLQVGVKALIQNEVGEYLFIRRSEKMAGEAEPHWDIPGGRIEPEEALEDALAREIREETSMELVEIVQLLGAQDIFPADKPLHVVRLTYRVVARGSVQTSEEHLESKWMTTAAALESQLDPYVRSVLERNIG